MDRIGQVLIGAPPRDRGLQVPRDLQLVRSFCLVKFEVGPIKAVEPRKEVAQPVDPASDSRGIEAQRSLRRQEDAEKPAQCRRAIDAHENAIVFPKGPAVVERAMPVASIPLLCLIRLQLAANALPFQIEPPLWIEVKIGRASCRKRLCRY